MRAAVLLAGYAIVAAELLSLAEAIKLPEIAIVWVAPILVSLVIAFRNLGMIRRPSFAGKFSWIEIGLLIGIISIIAITASVAWLTPPQTWDSLNYHMPRVAQWAQNDSLGHYATGIEIQNSRTPAAEILMLHFFVLSQADALATFVQWSAMLISLIGVSLVTKQLGGRRQAQLFAVIFVATLPMGIVQASSTVNDYVVAALTVAAASEVLNLRFLEEEVTSLLFFGLSSALAVATKPTAFAYILPLVIYAAYLLLKASRWRTLGRALIIGVALFVAINLGYLARNYGTYGSPINQVQVRNHSNELLSLRGVVSNLLKNVGLHLGTPSPHINKAIALGVISIHDLIALDVNDPRTTAHGVFKIAVPTTNEDQAGNPMHAYLLVLLSIYAIWKRPKAGRALVGYSIAVLGSLLAISLLFKWTIFASGFHLGLFAMAAPIAGVLIEPIGKERLMPLAAALLFLASMPWLFQVKSRPIIASPQNSYVDSILTELPDRLLLANGPHLLEPYREMTDRIIAENCKSVGITLSGNSAEYPLWVFLDAPFSSVKIQWIVGGTPSDRYFDEGFAPCAVICETCPADQARYRGLSRNETFMQYQLFLGKAE